MYHIFLVTSEGNRPMGLLDQLKGEGLACSTGSDLSCLDEVPPEKRPDTVILDMASLTPSQTRAFLDCCKERKWPVLTLVPADQVEAYDPSWNPDEFILDKPQPGELTARIKQAMYRVNGPFGRQVLKIGALVIDLERYDVTMNGHRISLTYKEFQLLALLVSNPGRVYSREALLSQVWGYDYLGGTRTVDVHIRRLRSKIEDLDHSFVETIWNVGYRFKAQP